MNTCLMLQNNIIKYLICLRFFLSLSKRTMIEHLSVMDIHCSVHAIPTTCIDPGEFTKLMWMNLIIQRYRGCASISYESFPNGIQFKLNSHENKAIINIPMFFFLALNWNLCKSVWKF